MSRSIDVHDYLGIQQLVATYVWALDTADLATLSTLFTEDAIMRDTSGREYKGKPAILAYFSELTQSPRFRGRQHHIDHPLFERTEEGYVCRSYWTVTKWDSAAGTKLIEVAGHSRDVYVRRGDCWVFQERLLYYWTSADCPWAGSAG